MDYFLQLLGDHNPKLNRRKLRSNAKSKNIMSFDVGIECQNKKLFLGAAESDIVEGINVFSVKGYKGWRNFGECPFHAARRRLPEADPIGGC